jgi:3-phosphoshikimate 1-carboxyvinyltransferase
LKLYLTTPSSNFFKSHIPITGSKSESNRSLLLQALYPNIAIDNLSNSDDAMVMQKGLQIGNGLVDIHHAGTAMRFLTAYFASQEGKEVVLTGSQRMTERPIQVLVEALRALGAEIAYEKQEGYPPLRIKGKKLKNNKVSLPANISSQYISALLLIAPKLPNGLELHLEGKITSVPYIRMTLGLLDEIGVENSFEDQTIKVFPKASVANTRLVVESDWSSASYFYSAIALADPGAEVRLSAYKQSSRQGDSVLAEIYESLGVQTIFDRHEIRLTKMRTKPVAHLELDLTNAPDIAQTIVVSCFGLGIGCHLTGLHTLKIKETDRLEALYAEGSKMGAKISVTDKSLTLDPSDGIFENIAIDTYNDHRMAMAFAPLALKTSLYINNAEVVSKSYPDFWNDLKQLGIGIDSV